jgi:hypothetical protein
MEEKEKLVAGPRGWPDTRTDRLSECQSQDNFGKEHKAAKFQATAHWALLQDMN